MSRASGDVDELRVAIARRQRREHQLARRDRHAGDLDVGGGDARDRGLHDRQPAQQLLDGGPDGVGVVAHRGQLVGMPQQRQRAEPEHVRRGLVAGQQQQAGDADEFVVGELVAVLADQHAEDVVAGVAAGARRPASACTRGPGAAVRCARASAATGRVGVRSVAGSRRGRRRARRAARRSPATGSAARSSRRDRPAARRLPSRRGARSTISMIRGSSRFIRRMVNSGVSMRRSRWCSGGSRPSRLPARALACSSSDSAGAPGSTNPGGRALEKRSWSDSTALTSSWRVTR